MSIGGSSSAAIAGPVSLCRTTASPAGVVAGRVEGRVGQDAQAAVVSSAVGPPISWTVVVAGSVMPLSIP